MGRIKTQLVKSVTHKLIEQHGEEFTKEFGENKTLVTKFADVPSKKIRNIIAGYITRLKKSGG
ncbi:30S ribosomal protein S17e [Candidatus Woesearchaeota archaeon]|nr:30S ribosomal protein S17e [Candidatus Woesearchaeota archaeon]